MATRQGRHTRGRGREKEPPPRVSREVDQRAGAFPHPFWGREAPPDNSYSHTIALGAPDLGLGAAEKKKKNRSAGPTRRIVARGDKSVPTQHPTTTAGITPPSAQCPAAQKQNHLPV
eukprot:scaffold13454_cov114-Isochrysis_galbana.AAC.3